MLQGYQIVDESRVESRSKNRSGPKLKSRNRRELEEERIELERRR